MKNAIKLYRQTRGSASPAAVAAAKQLLSGDANFDTDGDNIAIKLDVHPLFAHLLDEAESAAEKFKEQLKNFRPAQVSHLLLQNSCTPCGANIIFPYLDRI